MGFDGIPVGAIRSPRGNADMDAKIEPETWCQRVGHSYRKFSDGEACINCWRDRKEIESGLRSV